MKCLKCLKSLEKNSGHYGVHKDCFSEWFEVPNDTKFINLTRRSAASNEQSTDTYPQNNSFFIGKFKKYSALLNEQSYILKMRQAEAPELPEVEYLCNQIADALGIPVARYFMINFEGENVFVTKNFIHSNIPMDLQHISRFREIHQHTCKDLISIIKENTKQPYWVNIFVNTLLFDSLIGNHDRHGRNLGFLVMPNNISLAPIYDNVSYLSLESGNMLKADFNPLGKIATKDSQNPSMKEYIAELRNLGFESEIARFFTNLTSHGLKNIKLLIENSFCSDLMKLALHKLIDKRYMELKNEF